MVPGDAYTLSSLAMPFCRAVASETILNVEPGAYRPWVARLTSWPASSEPSDAAACPSSASTSPAL